MAVTLVWNPSILESALLRKNLTLILAIAVCGFALPGYAQDKPTQDAENLAKKMNLNAKPAKAKSYFDYIYPSTYVGKGYENSVKTGLDSLKFVLDVADKRGKLNLGKDPKWDPLDLLRLKFSYMVYLDLTNPNKIWDMNAVFGSAINAAGNVKFWSGAKSVGWAAKALGGGNLLSFPVLLWFGVALQP